MQEKTALNRLGDVILTAIVASVLVGCGIAHQAAIKAAHETAKAELDVAMVGCAREHTKKVPLIKCENAAFQAANQKRVAAGETLHLDLMHANHARRLVAAEKFDAGKITEGQYEQIIAESRVSQVAAEQSRNLQAANVAAQQQAAAAQQSQAAIARGRAIQDAFKPNTQTTNTNCNRVGNSVNCSSTSY